jgi:mono/diheme cytochrome c family protein
VNQPLTPLERESRRRAWRNAALLTVALYAAVLFAISRFHPNHPAVHARIAEHFKYGSIGAEPANGLPYRIFQVLPELFPEKLPGKGYASVGFIYEPGKDLPIGLARRKVYIDRLGLNCATCHTGTLRATPESQPRIILGMPANSFDLQAYFRFLSACASDGRFTAENLLAAIERHGALDAASRLVMKQAIWQTREILLERKRLLAFMDSRPDWGPGRVDTFNPYKTVVFHFPMENDRTVGTTDLPSIWNQRPRQGLQLHWDGNNDSMEERNKSAALGAGVTPASIDLRSMRRVEDWIRDDLKAPPYPFDVDHAQAARGAGLYNRYCADCHAFGGARTGKVAPIDEIGTDPGRMDSFTDPLAANMNTLFSGYPWRFTRFRKTRGYANMPLDGVWLRGPYLHNGSVPSLRDLLEKPEDRPKVFFRGYDVYDSVRAGFVSTVAEEGARKYFRYDTALPGNSNRGHLYGTQLPAADKDALVEYMKRL